MSEEKRLSEELLKQNGTKPGEISHDERERIQRLIARDKARLRRTKWAAIISWLLLTFLYVLAAIIGVFGVKLRNSPIGPLEAMVIGTLVIPCIAIYFTISYFLRSRSLTSRQMLASLSSIEEMLRRMSKDREADSEQ